MFDLSIPTIVARLEGMQVADIACGGKVSACLTTKGDLYRYFISQASAPFDCIQSLYVQMYRDFDRTFGGLLPMLHYNLFCVPVFCISVHCCLTLASWVYISWGHGDDGQLGHGDYESLTSPKLVRVHPAWSHNKFLLQSLILDFMSSLCVWIE